MRLFLSCARLALCLFLFGAGSAGAQDIRPHVFEWNLDHPDFGGLSAAIVTDQGEMLTVGSDRGGFFTARMVRNDRGVLTGMDDVVFTPLTSHKGTIRPESFHSDIESLSSMGASGGASGLAIGFESYSRIQILPKLGAVPQPTHAWDRFRDLFGNQAFEALATLPGGGLLAFVEGHEENGAGLTYFYTGTNWTAHRVPVSDGYSVTGADMGPDGCLYLLERRYSLLSGFRFRLRRLQQEGARWTPQLPWIKDELLYESPRWTFGNTEGLAAWSDARGVHLTLVTDNGFSSYNITSVIEVNIPHPCTPH